MELMYYGGFIVGIIFLIATVILYFVLDIRSIGRFLITKGLPVPKILKNSNKPLFCRKKKEPETYSEYVMKTEILEDEEEEINES